MSDYKNKKIFTIKLVCFSFHADKVTKLKHSPSPVQWCFVTQSCFNFVIDVFVGCGTSRGYVKTYRNGCRGLAGIQFDPVR